MSHGILWNVLALKQAVPFKTITTVILTEWYDTLKTIDNNKTLAHI